MFFEKYQLSRIIGRGRTGTVFLAVHLGLLEYRAIKRVPKSLLGYERFRKEALILKELHYPGIPIIYDLEEDSQYSYLIEEYLDGESLYSLVKRQGHLARPLVLRYGIQICRIVNYLHSAGTTPILFLDLQPKNLLVCHEQVKLVDFGQASYGSQTNILRERYGTVGFAAPEQYTSETMDERTDIYAIGVLLHYMGSGELLPQDGALNGEPKGRSKFFSEELWTVIRQCTNPEKEKRFSSAQEVCDKLQQILNARNGVFTEDTISSLTIAFAGSKSGVGTTHLAIGLSVYLRNQGYPNLYEERNMSGAAAAMARCFGGVRDRHGLFRKEDFVFKPRYGEAVYLEESPYSLHICDYGADLWGAAASGAKAVILICPGKWWDSKDLKEELELFGEEVFLILIYNRTLSALKTEAPQGIKKDRCFRSPCFENPFLEYKQTKSFYKSLARKLAETIGGGWRRSKRKGRLWRILRKITGL